LTRIELEQIVLRAVQTLYARDSNLFSSEGSEWSISHRLAVYLEQLLPHWNIDCEYNRQGTDSSRKLGAQGGLVRPDIVIHHRGRPALAHNLLVIELKRSDSEEDFRKLEDYTSEPQGCREFQYQHGLAITFETGLCFHWFKDGKRLT
jgi:hypothetical protein